MAINPATLIPAVIKAKNVATEDYVDTSTDGMLTDSNFNTNITTIDGGKITTNTLQADRLKAGTNATTVWTGGGLVSSNFDGNSYGNIGAPTRGFRLSSNADGTNDDPNMYGAHIKGGTLDGGIIKGATFIGALSKVVGFLNETAAAPGIATWVTVAFIASGVPDSAESFRLSVNVSVGMRGGNWLSAKCRVTIGTTVYPVVTLPGSLGGVSDITRFYVDATNRTTSAAIRVEVIQYNTGFSTAHTSTNVNILSTAVSI